MNTIGTNSTAPHFPVEPFQPRHSTWPYTASDFQPQDRTSDVNFYSSPRFVTHIDDHAISQLRKYYAQNLPKRGRILDFCSSWISHYPPETEAAAEKGELVVIGMGMNKPELDANKVLSDSEGGRIVKDLNQQPEIPIEVVKVGDGEEGLDAATCVVSIDYLTSPVNVLKSLNDRMKPGGTVHLAISNRCFPTKAIGRWLRVEERERLFMVGDYLQFAGWKNIEIVDLSGRESEDEGQQTGFANFMRSMGVGGNDPLWVIWAIVLERIQMRRITGKDIAKKLDGRLELRKWISAFRAELVPSNRVSSIYRNLNGGRDVAYRSLVPDSIIIVGKTRLFIGTRIEGFDTIGILETGTPDGSEALSGRRSAEDGPVHSSLAAAVCWILA
ncbi:MAG: hypothetical protein M1820_004350 [Bogoriella megaspora]|nr:MAG: hypothetical protein M1820_004350 [Bogoriella megaspora]